MRILAAIFFVWLCQCGEALEKCRTPVDIVFVIDTSSSIWIVNFPKQIQFIHDVIDMLDVGPAPDQSRVAAITFSNKVNFVFGFKNFTDKETVLSAIDEIKHDQGDATRTYLALDMVTNEAFADGNGDRKDVDNVVVVLTDGVTNCGKYDNFVDGGKAETVYQADVIKKLPAFVFAIGIGKSINMKELEDISSDPDQTFVITVSDFEELNTNPIKEKLLNRTCEAVGPPPPKQQECHELRADIFFVLDESSSIKTYENFQKELSLVIEAIDQVEIGPTKVQIGVLTFSDISRMQFHLDEYHTKEELVDAVTKIEWHGLNTYTNEAIDMLIMKGLNTNFGARDNVPHIAVIVTDGMSTEPELTKLAVAALKQTDIITFAVGVGPEYPKFKDELINMASSEDYTFEVENLDRLVDLRKELVQFICDAETIEDGGNKEEPQKEEECKERKADIMFLLDGSTSIRTEETFEKELDFVISVVDAMDIGPTQTQIGVTQFASIPQLEFNLNEYKTKDEVATAIKNIKWMTGNTMLNLAIEEVLEKMTPQYGLRRDVPHILVLVSDGVSTRRSKTLEMIQKLKDNSDIIVFGIGVGPMRDMQELKSLVAEPISAHLFEVENQDALRSIRSQLVTSLCQADPPAEEVCSNKIADIIFVADASTSIGEQDFEKLKKFMKDVVGSFTTGPENIQIGLITFSTTATTEFILNKYRDADEIEKAIDAVKWTTGDTYTNLALEELLTNGFTQEAGARSSVPHVAIVVTDGWSKKPQETMNNAKKAKDQGIIMFSIGVGPYLDKDELNAMSSEPTSEYSFMVEDYGALENIRNSVASRACSAHVTKKGLNFGKYSETRSRNLAHMFGHARNNVNNDALANQIRRLNTDMRNRYIGHHTGEIYRDTKEKRLKDDLDQEKRLKADLDQEKLLSLLKMVLDRKMEKRQNF